MTQSDLIIQEQERKERRDREYFPRIDQTKEPLQGHPPDPIPPEDRTPIDYGIADASIGDVQYWLKRFGKKKPLIEKAFKKAFRILARRRAELRKEKLNAH